MSKFLKSLVDRLALGAGVVSGTIALALLGVRPIPLGETFGYWVSYLAFAAWGLVLISASFGALRSRKLSAAMLLLCVPVVGISLVLIQVRYRYPDAAREFLQVSVIALAPPLGLSSYWWISHKLGWTSVCQTRFNSQVWKVAAFALIAVFIFSVLFSSALFFASQRPGFSVNCKKGPPFASPTNPQHAVFTARIVSVCCSAPERLFPSFGGFAVAIVTKRFWGLPWWNPGIVFLTQDISYIREPLFVSGALQPGILGNLLSIVEISICGRTTYLQNAQIDLRLLRDGPPKGSIRVIGETYRTVLSPKYHYEKIPSVIVRIKGPDGTITTVSDADGIYDVSGLPPGAYTFQTDSYDPKSGDYSGCGGIELIAGSIGGCPLEVK
jgi:hypothetical protein